MDILFECRNNYFDIMINYHFSQKLKLIENGEFNH